VGYNAGWGEEGEGKAKVSLPIHTYVCMYIQYIAYSLTHMPQNGERREREKKKSVYKSYASSLHERMMDFFSSSLTKDRIHNSHFQRLLIKAFALHSWYTLYIIVYLSLE
jgi:hypothetical protein